MTALPTASAIGTRLRHHLLELRRMQTLRAIAPRLVGLWVHFDDHAISANRNRGARQRRHRVTNADTMTRVADDRQVRQPLHNRNRREVVHIARRRVVAADTALTQDHLAIAFRHDVFGGQQPFRYRGRHAALEQHRHAQLPDVLEQ